MRSFASYAVLLIAAFYLTFMLHDTEVDALCCDNDNWDWVKKGCCVASCMGQNCGTGDCHGRTCVCARCDVGPSVQLSVSKG